MADETVGHYWSQAAKERKAMEQHDLDHPGDPAQYWGECNICAERAEADIEAGTRCKHSLKAGECGPCEVATQLEIDKAIDNDISYQEHGL